MSMLTQTTPEALLVMPDGKDFELVGGELLERHVSFLTSYMATVFGVRLSEFVVPNGLGYVLGADCGYRCFPDDSRQVRKPDVSFVSSAKLSADEIDDGWATVVPDLVVEIVSPNDVAEALNTKLGDYASAGIPLVWVVYPKTSTAFAYRADGSVEQLEQPVEFIGEGRLDGFHCTLADLLPGDPQDVGQAPTAPT